MTLDDLDFSDLTTAVRDGAAWSDGTYIYIPFAPEPTPAEQERILIRIMTVDAAQEQLFVDAANAISNNAAWRTNTAPQIVSGAQTIEGTTGTFASNTVRDGYIRQEAQGLRVNTQQVIALTRPRGTLLRMVFPKSIPSSVMSST